MVDYTLHCGDCVDYMATMADNTYTAVFCDPPYGLGETPDMAEVLTHWLAGDDYKASGGGFMGKSWDSFVPGPSVWREVYRVCKPGAVLLAFGGTRTADLLSIAIRLAGWQRWDEIVYFWTYGSGFPKSHNIGNHVNSFRGYGTALKPSYEPILCFRKPLEGTYAHSALTYGTATLNIDGCRVAVDSDEPNKRQQTGDLKGGDALTCYGSGLYNHTRGATLTQGRWPANMLHDGSDEVMAVFDRAGVRKVGTLKGTEYLNGKVQQSTYGAHKGHSSLARDGDTGSAARFFYCAKASSSERTAGLDGNNPHPTVKPLALTEYLARLIVPPESYRDDAQLLIPFCGVGSEAIGAALAGWRHITGIELDETHCEINRKRFNHWTQTVQPSLLEVA